MPGPLHGTLVLDLSRVLAGPWASQSLADMGARVIKVEHPQGGDDTRSWGPPYHQVGNSEESAYFLSANRGKESLAINFKDPRGQAVLHTLAGRADILLENYKVGGLKPYKLDYEAVRRLNPAIVYCSISGFGQTGPYALKPGYDFVIQAMSGLMSITGDKKPTKVGVAVSDLITGLYATIGILAAYTRARETGQGEHIDVSLLDSQLAALANQASNYLVSGKSPVLAGNAHPNIVPYQVFDTADTAIVVAVGNDSQYACFCRATGLEKLINDRRFATNSARVEHRQVLVPILAEVLAGQTTETWLSRLEQFAVPAGPVNSVAEAFSDPHVLERGVVMQMERDDTSFLPGVRSPIRFTHCNMDKPCAPPALGNSSESILREAGLDDAAIEALVRDGIIARPE